MADILPDSTEYKLTIKSTNNDTSKSQTLSINRIKPELIDESNATIVSAFVDEYQAVYSDVTVEYAEVIKTEKTRVYDSNPV